MKRSGQHDDLLLSRGVWKAPFLVGGAEVLLAVDSRRDMVGQIVLKSGVEEQSAKEELEALLDTVDRGLQLVVTEPPIGLGQRVASDG